MGKEKNGLLYILSGILMMLCLGTVYSYSIFRPYVEEFYQAGTTESGLPYMFSLAFYALFMMITGKFIGSCKLGTLTRIGGLLVGSGWILSGFADNIFVLTITYGMVLGAGVGILYGVPLNLVTSWFPKQKGAATGLVLVGFGLSPVVTAPMAEGYLELYGLHKTFQILGLGFFIILLLLSFLFRYPSQSVSESKVIAARNLFWDGSFRGLYLTFTIGTMIGLLIVGMTANVGTELIGISTDGISWYIAVFAVFNGAGRPFFGWLADKVSFQKAMMTSYLSLILGAGLLLIADKGNLILYVTGFAIFWFNLGGWLAIAPAATMYLFGTSNYSRNYGIVFTAYGIGAIAGVLVSGKLKESFTSYTAVFIFIILLCILGLFIKSKTIWKRKELLD
ncbi:MFS transporter [Anaerocolumna cellulosilytica]|uniref:MFS transporter n=1 Tax=Anaerocolumna cellulosilytica TaxID=433286 RepID=A0A6S6QZM8_9FIRM|nr:MFS transporter [Anaerocolumna cellulosilytica]MBB5194279.1 MFS family permease [Anaerocolumna cellulosilytica]BCJ94509.1 MFS transporter [Anaerocolumna cellulosilytica]